MCMKTKQKKTMKLPQKRILFTLTTVLSRPDKLAQTTACLKSIQRQEPRIGDQCHVVIINECGNTSGKFLLKQFPWISRVIDKRRKYCGQAKSLNMVIRMLHRHRRQYLYWLHWEESWVAKRPFIQLCTDAMDMGVDQMQLTQDDMTWNTNDMKKRTPHNRYLYINARNDDFKGFQVCRRRRSALHSRSRDIRSSKKCRDDMHQTWPLWSLRPAMDRAEKVLNVGYFDESDDMWPVHFELEWAYNWATQKGGVCKAGAYAAYRQSGHISFSETYASGGWEGEETDRSSRIKLRYN